MRCSWTGIAVVILASFAAGAASVEESVAVRRLLDSTDLADLRRASELCEARVGKDPDDYEARLGASVALTQMLAIRTNGNLPLVDGVQDSAANRALWGEVAPRALEHARHALALQPDSIEAAAALATAYMFHASSMGIVASITSGAATEFRANTQRVIDLDPAYEQALGHYMLASFYLVAPWPVSDTALSREHYERATALAPESVRNQYGFGVYWARDGDAARARRHFERAIQLPCESRVDRLLCDWIKETSKGALAELGRG